jgi:hypothetical protein
MYHLANDLGGVIRYLISILRFENKPITDFIFTSYSDKTSDEIDEIDRKNTNLGLTIITLIVLLFMGISNFI